MAAFATQIFTAKTGRDFTMRSLTPADAEDGIAFLKKMGEESNHTLQYPGRTLPTVEANAKRYEDSANHPLSIFLAVFDQQKLISIMSMQAMYPDHPWIKHIGYFGMSVLKDYWGHGVGSRLLKEQETWAAAAGFKRIEAHVRTHNDRGLKLYEQNGFIIEGRRQRAALIDGVFLDEFYIAKLL